MIDEDAEADSPACFEKPVAFDIVDGSGRKLAGAGQRRSRRGLLHQGSVILSPGVDADAVFRTLAHELASAVNEIRREPSAEDLAASVNSFASRSWLERR